MITTIDTAGRMVIPKPIREALSLKPGHPLNVSVVEGHIELEPTYLPVKMVEREGILIAEPQEAIPPITAEEIREALEQVRK